MEMVTISGSEILSIDEKKWLMQRLSLIHDKVQRNFKDPVFLVSHIKSYEPEGRKKFSVHIHLHGACGEIEAHNHDYDLSRCLQKILDKLLSEMEHVFRAEDKHAQQKKMKKIRKKL